MLKRIRVLLHPEGPDHYIFESNGMAELAMTGAGIPASRVSVIHLGVDTDAFRPNPQDTCYVYETLGIPQQRHVFFYSGHMEPRKGVAVIMQAANHLRARRERDDWHIVLCGDKGTESAQYVDMLSSDARERVTFAGYRPDVPSLQRGSYAAIIASTGWDSFPRSGLEMQASGLPLIASDLIGLRESIEDGVSGFLFPVGNAEALADAMTLLLDEPSRRDQLSRQARVRVEHSFAIQGQLASLISVMRATCG
jgi:glycosyltransferase involved in cell wall biosynthesis